MQIMNMYHSFLQLVLLENYYQSSELSFLSFSEHKEELKQIGCSNVEKKHEECFSKWFERRVSLFINTYF